MFILKVFFSRFEKVSTSSSVFMALVKILVSQKYFTYLQHFPKKCRTAVNALGPPLTEVPLNGSIM